MKRSLCILFAALVTSVCTFAQSVPQVIRYSGTTKASKHGPVTAGAVFSIYAQKEGGAALWQEVQNVAIDSQGRYSVTLGAFSKEGVPASIFGSGDARWLGVSINGAPEGLRQQLVSVPYAMKSKDADTLNGLTAAEIVAEANGGTVVAATSPQGTSATNGAAPSGASLVNQAVINTTATDFTDTNTTQVVNVHQSGTGSALKATSGSTTTNTLQGINTAATGTVRGVYGEANSTSTSSAGVYGISKATSGVTYGVLGLTSSTSGTALNGTALATTGGTIGLRGQANSDSGTGVVAAESSSTGFTTGVNGFVLSPDGVAAIFDNRAGGEILSLETNGTEVASVDGTGKVVANSFTGNGAGLTNVAALTAATATNAISATTATTAVNFTGNLSGDVTGTQVATQVAALGGQTLTMSVANPGEAIRWNGSAWTPAKFVDEHYYPAGVCNDAGTVYPQWQTRHTGEAVFGCIHGTDANFAVAISFGGLMAGPDVQLPSDWDGSNIGVNLKVSALQFIPNVAVVVTLVGNITCTNDNDPAGFVNSTSTFTTILNHAAIADTRVRSFSGTLPPPAGCVAGSVMHMTFGENASPLNFVDMVGVTVRINRYQ